MFISCRTLCSGWEREEEEGKWGERYSYIGAISVLSQHAS